MPLNVDKISTGSLSVNGTDITGNALQTVAVDGVTITGNGTLGNPLVAVGGGEYTYELGEYVSSEGGVIFYRWKTGSNENYLVVALTQNFLQLPWSSVNSNIGPAAQSSYDGISNTQAIITQGDISGAAYYCDNFNDLGKSDWYLPAIDELNQLFDSRFVVNFTLNSIGANPLGHLSNGMINIPIYWSSTENVAVFSPIPPPMPANAFVYNFFTGTITIESKNTNRVVRPIRRFSL